MAEAEERRVAELRVKRLRALGVTAELLPGGRAARARMPLARRPFPLPAGERVYDALLFATVGATHIKCLAPEPFFQLPLIPIADCTSAPAIEERVRAAFTLHARALRDAERALREVGVDPVADPDTGGLCFPIGVEDRGAEVRCLDARRLSLPSRGPLSGRVLARASERVAERPRDLTSASEIEIALTDQLEALARRAKPARQARQAPPSLPPRVAPAPRSTPAGSGHRLLLVGPLLGRDTELVQGLRHLGHRTRIEYALDDALGAFSTQSFELVLIDARVGRAEGLELVPALAALPGIGRLPVVLIDERPREGMREAARRAGAAGYLAHPLDAARIAAGLGRLLRGRGQRRFGRVGHRLDVRSDHSLRGFSIAIGRLGLSLRTPHELPAGALERFTIRLPELDRFLRVDAQTVYRIPAAGVEDPIAGLRIRSFPDRNEPLWIEYLTALAGSITGH